MPQSPAVESVAESETPSEGAEESPPSDESDEPSEGDTAASPADKVRVGDEEEETGEKG